jgi:hypothetical protein
MADAVTPPILNPQSASRYDGLYQIARCHVADTCQKTTNPCVFFKLLAEADSEAYDYGIFYYATQIWGPRGHSWLRHCATNRQVASSIPDGVSEFFHWHNPVGRTLALGPTQPLTEKSTRNISWGVNAAGAYGCQPTTFMCRLSRNPGASTPWNPVGLFRPVMGLLYLVPFTYTNFPVLMWVTVLNLHIFNASVGFYSQYYHFFQGANFTGSCLEKRVCV